MRAAERVAEEWRWELERFRHVNAWRRAMGLERLDGTEPTGRVQQPPRYFYADGPEADLW